MVVALSALLDRQLHRDEGISNFEYSVMARLSKLMAWFEQQGWITRRPCSTNGRYTLATLTDAGMRKVEDSAPAHVEQVR